MTREPTDAPDPARSADPSAPLAPRRPDDPDVGPKPEASADPDAAAVTRAERDDVRAARRGDRAAFGRLVERHRPAVVASLRRWVRDPHRADDLAQDTLLRAMRRIRQVRSDIRVRPWLLAIARNVAIDLARRRTRDPMVELREPESAPADEVREAPRDYGVGARVWGAIRCLPPREQRLVLLRYERGLSNREVARECGLNEDVVKVSLHRSRRRLRRWIEDGGAGGAAGERGGAGSDGARS